MTLIPIVRNTGNMYVKGHTRGNKMNVIIRGDGESKRFKPHMNMAIGKYIHTREDYLRELKKNNLIPQEEARKIAEQKKRERERPHKPSKWAHEMVEELRRSKGNPGTAYYKELEKKGYGYDRIQQMKKTSERAKNLDSKGGFTDGSL